MTAHKFVDFIYEQNKAPVSELADMAGVARNSICRWKNGTSPRLVDIDAVLGVLGYELVIARKHRPDYEPERMAILIQKVQEILSRQSPDAAREIVCTIGEAYEGNTCLDLSEECIQQSRTITEYVNEVAALQGRITELELSSGYRTGATDQIRALSIGEKKLFLAGDRYTQIRKRLWNIANMAGMKIKTRSIQKNGLIQIEITRVK